MKQGANGRRTRGRSGGRKQVPLKMQNFDSNGPDVRIRGHANQVYEKYLALARDSNSAGDRVIAESYLQHAEHYYRIMNDDMDPAPESANDGDARTAESAEPNQAQPQANGTGGNTGAATEGSAKAGANGGGRNARRGTRQERRERHERAERDDRDGPTDAEGAGSARETAPAPSESRPKQRPDGFGRLPETSSGGREDATEASSGDTGRSDSAAAATARPAGDGAQGETVSGEKGSADGEAPPRKTTRRAAARPRRSTAARTGATAQTRRRKAASGTDDAEDGRSEAGETAESGGAEAGKKASETDGES